MTLPYVILKEQNDVPERQNIKYGEAQHLMKRSEQFRQANREAKYTCYATVAVILFWILAGFGLSGSDLILWDTPVWVIGGCIGTWLFSVAVAFWLAEYVIQDVETGESADNEGGDK